MSAIATKATSCRACSSTLSEAAVLDLGMQPLANNLCDEERHSDEVYPLRVVRCFGCGLLQLDTVIDPAAMFSHYLYTPSQSKKTLAHFEDLAEVTTRRFIAMGQFLDVHSERRDGPFLEKTVSAPLAIDVGSNDGCLIGFLKAQGWRVAGVDPAANLAAEANAKGLTTICRFFDETAVNEILAVHGQAKLVTANNVFAHSADWKNFVRCTERLLAPGGLLVIEFPYGPVMLRDGTLDLIYLEHISFPAIGPLKVLLEPLGLCVFGVDVLSEIHGGSVRVWVGRISEFTGFDCWHVGSFMEHEEQARSYTATACDRFAFRAKMLREQFVDAVRTERKNGKRVIGYTAPAKAVTLIEFCGLTIDDIFYVIDDNPLKQGKLLPHSHIPVVAPKDVDLGPGDTVIIFAWNVAEDIMAKLPSGVDVIVPMPRVEVIRRREDGLTRKAIEDLGAMRR